MEASSPAGPSSGLEATEKSLAGPSSAGTGPSLLRYAAQPDVVLSQERDLYYADTLIGESASELAETLLGSRRAMILGPELKALASCLYFGLTNFMGKQTLGQEYCGIKLVTAGGDTTTLSRAPLQAYTFLRVAVPYLQERLRDGWHGLLSLRDPFGGGGAAAALAMARARARARAALVPPVGIALSVETSEGAHLTGLEPGASESGAEGEGVSPSEGSGETALLPLAPRRQLRRRRRWRWQSSLSSALAKLRRFLAWARRRRPVASSILEWVLRLHLAAFYFDGRFASVAMRAVGARLAYTGPQDEPRARYAILGVFLLVQAVAEAASASADAATRWRVDAEAATQERASGGPGAEGGSGGLAAGDDAALQRVPAVSSERTPADAALFPRSHRRCSLCMSTRDNAAATPCGHLFCWECIVGWCQTNPECPLCRQPATPQSIVCLYQYA